jgi:hypothetical protein
MKFARTRKAVTARLCRKRTTRRLLSKRKAHLRRFVDSGQLGQSVAPWRGRANPSRERRHVVQAPHTFGVLTREHRATLLTFIRKLRRLVLVFRTAVYIDFAETRKMQPEGTVLFAAELDRIVRQAKPRVMVRCARPKDPVVEQVLNHLGLLALMKRTGTVPVNADSVRYWQVETGDDVVGESTKSVVTSYRQSTSEADSSHLYRGLTEAMTNCKHHAYTQDRGDGTGVPTTVRWWMFSQMKDDKLHVSLCDLGIGFKRSLLEGKEWPVRTVYSIVDKLSPKRNDSSFIRAALKLGESRTGQKHRGKGLPELLAVIQSRGGWLRILSNAGLYTYRPASPGTSAGADTKDFTDSILGTIISWELPLGRSAK